MLTTFAKRFAAALGLACLLACDTDVTSEYDIPHDERLVVTAFISPQDTLLAVRVGKTAPVTGVADGRNQVGGVLTNARVTLSEGARSVTLPFRTYQPDRNSANSEVGGYFLESSRFPIEAGKTYTLRVSTPEGLQAEAQCTVPEQALAPEAIDVRRETRLENGTRRSGISVRIKDFPGAENRYAVTIFQTYEPLDQTGKVFFRDRYAYFNQYLTDAQRDGEWLNSRWQPTYPADEAQELYVAHTDLPYFEYNTTATKQLDAEGNPFAEPQPVYSNVRGGLGVFAAYQVVKVPVVW